jgi:hypothetical protein
MKNIFCDFVYLINADPNLLQINCCKDNPTTIIIIIFIFILLKNIKKYFK